MLRYIEILGIPIPSYALMATLGVTMALFIAFRLAKRYGIMTYDVVSAAGYGGIGLMVGAKLFYAIPFLGKLDEQPLSVIFSGYVFYGGLIGLIAGVLIYGKWRNLPLLTLADILAVIVPLFHGFGRIGCFLAGCCYGKEYHGPFAVKFPPNPYEPGIETVSRFPVQLTESMGNFILFGVLFWYSRKNPPSGRLMGIYLIAYPVMRFFLEMMRGDEIRGVIELAGISISTSQVVSLLLLPVGIFLLKKSQ